MDKTHAPITLIVIVEILQLLGNMAGFLSKGVDGYVMNGMPWPFQNGTYDGFLFVSVCLHLCALILK